MKTFILTFSLMIVSQAEAGVTQTCKDWKEAPSIKEYNGKSYAVGVANCKVWDNRPIASNLTHGFLPTELFCLYTKRDDVQACSEDGNYGIFDSKAVKQQMIETKAAYKVYLAEKKKANDPAATTTTTADAGH